MRASQYQSALFLQRGQAFQVFRSGDKTVTQAVGYVFGNDGV
jgi:hypothetical protein